MMMMMMMTTVQEESKRDLKSLMQIHISSNVYLNFTERKRNIITTSWSNQNFILKNQDKNQDKNQEIVPDEENDKR